MKDLKLCMSDSGDWFLVPLHKVDDFNDDELEGNADYATYVELHQLIIKSYSIG